MLLADVDASTAGVYAAIAGLLVAAGNYVQSVIKDRKDARVARLKEAADKRLAEAKAAADKRHLEETAAKLAVKTDETARAITAEVKTVQQQVNGDGLGGKIDAVLKWQTQHDHQDNERYDGLVAEILKLKGKADGDAPRPPAGG